MINQLVKKIKEMEAPIVVGLDPMWNYIPQHIQKKAVDEMGETLEAAAEAVGSTIKELLMLSAISFRQ